MAANGECAAGPARLKCRLRGADTSIRKAGRTDRYRRKVDGVGTCRPGEAGTGIVGAGQRPDGPTVDPERHVNALSAWGIEGIEIEADEAPEPEVEVSPEIEAAARAELQVVFQHAGSDHPFIGVLLDLAVDRRAHALALEAMEVA